MSAPPYPPRARVAPPLERAGSRRWAWGCALLFLGLGLLGLYRPLDVLFGDLWTRLTPARAQPDIVIVAIDEATLARYGRVGTWKRSLYAQAVETLLEAGARGVGVDVLFPERTPEDAALAKVLADPRVVLADAAQFGRRVPRNPALLAARYGAVLLPSSRERIVRAFQPAYLVSPGEAPVPSLASMLLGQSSGDTRARLIRYAGPPGVPFKTVSFADVVSGNVRYGALQDRYALIGVTAGGLERDEFLTPYLEPGAPLSLYGPPLPMPGVEVQASALATLLGGGFLELPEGLALLTSALLLLAWSLRQTHPAWSVGVSAALLALSAGLHLAGVYLPVGALALAAPLGLALHSVLALREAGLRVSAQLQRMGETPAQLPAPLSGRLELLRRVEERLALERQQLALLIGGVDQPLFLASLTGRALVVNPACQGFLEVGESIFHVLPERLGLEPEALAQGGVGQAGRLERVGERGVLSLTPVGEGRALVGMLTPPDRLMQSLRERERFEESFVHGLRGPLTTLLGFAEYLEEVAQGPHADILRLMRDEAERMKRLLVQHALSWEAQGLRPERLDASSLVRRSVGAQGEALEARGLHLALELPLTLPLDGDEQQLSRLLGCLLENAVRFSPPGGTVRLRLWQQGTEVYFEVQDEGLGIAEADLGRIFSRHYRGEGGSEARGGESGGLGLWTARELARAHGGDVLVQSRLGEGSTFTLVLPAPGAIPRSSLELPLERAGD